MWPPEKHKFFPALLCSSSHPLLPTPWSHKVSSGIGPFSLYSHKLKTFTPGFPLANICSLSKATSLSSLLLCLTWQPSTDTNPLSKPHFLCQNAQAWAKAKCQKSSEARGGQAEHVLGFSKSTNSHGCSLAASIAQWLSSPAGRQKPYGILQRESDRPNSNWEYPSEPGHTSPVDTFDLCSGHFPHFAASLPFILCQHHAEGSCWSEDLQ